MALAHCILGKFLGVGCHCFPPCVGMSPKYSSVATVANFMHSLQGIKRTHYMCTCVATKSFVTFSWYQCRSSLQKVFMQKNGLSVSHSLLEHVNESYLYCTIFIDQFRWNSLWDLYIILVKIYECHENWHREGHTLPVCIHEITFGNNEYNESLGKVFVLLHRVHHLQVIHPIVFLANKSDSVMCEHNC